MRADLALKELLSKSGVAAHGGYGVIGERFSELVKRMKEDCEARGVVAKRNRVGLISSCGKPQSYSMDLKPTVT